LMRAVSLYYLRDSEVATTRGNIQALRFHARDLLHPDPGDRAPVEGMLDLGYVSLILYGSATPTTISRPYFYGVNQTKYSQYMWPKCLNCPDIPDAGWEDQVDSVVDVEPMTGKVIGGHKRAQVNAHVGQPMLFGRDCEGRLDDPEANMYACMKEGFIPVFWFEDGAILNDDNAKTIQDGLSSLRLGKAAVLIVRWTFVALALILLVVTLYQVKKIREHHDGYEEMHHPSHRDV